MSLTVQIAVRLEADLIERVNLFRKRQQQRTSPGIVIKRSDAVRMLLEYALAQAGLPNECDAFDVKPTKKRRPRHDD